MSVKNYGTASAIEKVRYVAQEYSDKEKRFLVHGAFFFVQVPFV